MVAKWKNKKKTKTNYLVILALRVLKACKEKIKITELLIMNIIAKAQNDYIVDRGTSNCQSMKQHK